jgi:uncharacterized membrane protein YkvA (DUF1232 family)
MMSSAIPSSSSALPAFSSDQRDALRKALDGAKAVLKRRFRVLLLVRDAYEHIGHYPTAIQNVQTDLVALLRLLKAWALRQYQRVPWAALLLMAGAVVYFVMPADLIPDLLLGIGFVDDAAVVSAVVRTVRNELDRFRTWERRARADSPSSTLKPAP